MYNEIILSLFIFFSIYKTYYTTLLYNKIATQKNPNIVELQNKNQDSFCNNTQSNHDSIMFINTKKNFQQYAKERKRGKE